MLSNDDTWNSFPGNLTNAADVLANGDPPVYPTRPDFPEPAAHANNAAATVVSIYMQALDEHVAYTLAKAANTNRSPIGQPWQRQRNVSGGNDVLGSNLLPFSPPDCCSHVHQTWPDYWADYWARPAKA